MISSASATVPDCGTGDAPFPFSTFDCSIQGNAPCKVVAGELKCDLSICHATRDFVAVNYASNQEISVFGFCDLPDGGGGVVIHEFCCIHDTSTIPISEVTLNGGKGPDTDMGFWYEDGLIATYELADSGTSLAAVANGAKGDDLIRGSNRSGNKYKETLRGDAGEDTIFGNAGADIIYGGGEDDNLNGGDGPDKIYGEGGFDIINGGAHADKLYGGDNDDLMDGGFGTDTMYGESGNDTMYGGYGNDTMLGGPGNDVMRGGFGQDSLIGEAGDDTLHGEVGQDQLHGGSGSDMLDGGPHDDVLYGSRGLDHLFGEGGDDFLCDTNLRNIDNTCPSNNRFFSSVTGIDGFDKAWQEVAGQAGCASMGVIGNGSVLEARDLFWGWDQGGAGAVLDTTGTIVSTSTPYTECADIRSKWGL